MFWQTPWIFSVFPFIVFICILAVCLLFLFRKHSNWSYCIPILICWVIMLLGEVGKQIYYHGAPARLPINFCGVLLLLIPLYLLSYWRKWKRCLQITAICAYVNSFCVFVSFFIFPKLLVNSLPSSGIFWDNYQDFWGIIYHTLVSFVAFWFLFHHSIKARWIDLVYVLAFCLILILAMGLSSYFDPDLNYGNIAKDIFPLSIGLHILVVGSIYWIGGGLGYLLWKCLIQKILPDLLTMKNKIRQNYEKNSN